MVDTELLTHAEAGNAQEVLTTLKQKALDSLYFFTKVVLNYRDLGRLHVEFTKRIADDIDQRKRGYLMPRGHFKSTIVSKSYPLWRLCHDPETRILIVGESDTVAAKNLKDIKWNLLNNQMLQSLFPEIIPPDVNKTKWTDSEILLPRNSSYDESSITTVGVGAKTTGFHFDLIIYDDMIGEKAAKSQAEMQAAIEWFDYAPGLLNNPAFGEEILIGTRWKPGIDDLYGYIIEGLQATESETGRKTGFTWYIRAALEDEEGNPDRQNGKPIFPERFTRETLEEIAAREKEYKFSCQYMNHPTAPGATDFPEEWIQYYTVDADRKTLNPCDGTKPVKLTQLYRLSFYDPSAGGKTAKAQNGICVLAGSADRRIFILEPWGKNCSFGDAIEQWHRLNDRFHCHENWYEEVGAQKSVEDIIKERNTQVFCPHCKRKHRKLRPLPFHPPGGKGEMNKDERIRFYAQPAFQEGRVYLRKGSASSALKNQIVSFPHGKLKDLFDSCASGIHKLKFPPSEEALAEEANRNEKAQMPRAQRTNTTQSYGGYI
jgi:hypothetical protein